MVNKLPDWTRSQDIQWLGTTCSIMDKCRDIIHELNVAESISEEAMGKALKEAEVEFKKLLKELEELPQPKGKAMNKVRQGGIEAIKYHTRSVECYLKYIETRDEGHMNKCNELIDKGCTILDKTNYEHIPKAIEESQKSG